MPRYKVIARGFANGRLYDPHGKRTVLHRDTKFPMDGKKELVPSWLEPMAADAPRTSKARPTKKAVEQAKKDIDAASFMGAGESGAVETL